MVTALDVVRVAESQVGYQEGYLDNGRYHVGPPWNNIQKYSPAVPGLEWSQGRPYCCTGVSWVAMVAGAANLFPRTASVAFARDWWRGHGRLNRNPMVGDQVIFGANGDAHTGVLVGLSGGLAHTVEFNSNNNGSAQGDGVYALTHDLNDPWIYGYGHPAYAPAAPLVPAVSLYVIQRSARHHWLLRYTAPGNQIQVLRVRRALAAEACRKDWTAWETKIRHSPADGVPDRISLTKLGSRHGFRVVP